MNRHEQNEAIRTGMKGAIESGNSKLANRVCYGYCKNKSGQLEIDEEQARVVRLIFKMYSEGASYGKIAKELESKGIASPTGKRKWNREAISKLLSNEKYTGDVLLQKTFAFCGMQMKNEGEIRQVQVSNHHPQIIGKDEYLKVQKIKKQKSVSR